MMNRNVEGTREKLTLLYLGLGLAILGIIIMLVFGPGLSFMIGLITTAFGFIFFGVGLRTRIMRINPTLGNLVAVATSLSSVILIAWYLLL